ncbi:MAG: diguanylate cyclase [Acidaminococcaceae bacterium]
MLRTKIMQFICVLLLIFSLPQGALAAGKLVRVGFLPNSGFQETDAYGNKHGYNIQYLKRIAYYTKWEYEYVQAESEEELRTMLKAGRIDLIGGITKNVRFAQDFVYSDLPGGTTYNVLLTTNNHPELSYEDFSAFDNLSVGCIEGYASLDGLERYANTNHFTLRLRYFENQKALRQGLADGLVQAIAGRVWLRTEYDKLLGKYQPVLFYYVLRPGNPLISELNRAMKRILVETPNFERHLYDIYFGTKDLPAFSKAETTLLKTELPIRVALLRDRFPYSSLNVQTMQMEGILPDILRLAAEKHGINLQIVPTEKAVSPVEFLKAGGEAELVGDILRSDINLVDEDLLLGEPYLLDRIIMLGLAEGMTKPLTNQRITVVTGYRACIDYLATNYPELEIVLKASTKECLDAVLAGEAEFTMQDYNVVQRWLQRPQYEQLLVLPKYDAEAQITLGSLVETNPVYLTTLGKALKSVSENEKNTIVMKHTIGKTYEYNFTDFFYKYRDSVLGISFFALLACWGLWNAWQQKQKNLNLVAINEQNLQQIADNLNGGIITLCNDELFTVNYANDGFLALLGQARRTYVQQPGIALSTYLHQEDFEQFIIDMSLQEGKTTFVTEVRLRRADQGYTPVLFKGTLGTDTAGQQLWFCLLTDITAQKTIQANLEKEKERYRSILEFSDDIILDIDIAERTLTCSHKFYEVFGWELAGDLQTAVEQGNEHLFAEDAEAAASIREDLYSGRTSFKHRIRIQKTTGTYLWCELQMYRITTATKEADRYLGRLVNVDKLMREYQELLAVSQTDALTQLYNKDAFTNKAREIIDSSECTSAALFFVDLDNFKNLNDTLGHMTGDQALRDLSAELRGIFRRSDVLGRFGGDEFCVLAQTISREMAETKARELCQRLQRTYADRDNEITISASVGVALAPQDGLDYEELLGKADKALYNIKENGKSSYRFYDEL